MSLSLLSQASALNPGSDLWVIPELGASPWSGKIDWYLNFQISKATRHEVKILPDFLIQTLQETEQEIPKTPEIQNPQQLMIASHGLLPNTWVVIVPWTEDLNTWIARVQQLWRGLKQPSVRLFLPPGLSTAKVQHAWKTDVNEAEITVVLD